MLHQEKIIESLNTSVKLISGDGYEFDGVLEKIKKTSSLLNSISSYYKQAEEMAERIESARLELEDISDTLEQSVDNLYLDEQKAKENEERLDLLSSFKKKYGSDIPAINDYRERIGKEYDKLINSYERIEELKKAKDSIEKVLVAKAQKLTDARKKAALNFESAVKKELSDLGMKNATFIVDFKPLDVETLTASGLDKVEFMFSANLGEKEKPLKDVASGGEMSRFMLAVKNITAKIEGIGTLVFDEIDTGVSGQIALVLAEKLAAVSSMAQVICVTHLAQIASFGKTHFNIEKNEHDGKTYTMVTRLEEDKREEEISRLIGGNKTENSLKYARELLQSGKKFYKI